MQRILSAVLGASIIVSGVVSAQAKERLGHGRLIVNDLFGDGHDRWRTGSISASHVYGTGWDDALPYAFGEIVEYRIFGQIISPEDIDSPVPGDRPYAGALSIGAHTHFERQGYEFALGGDIVVIGPQTGLDDLQEAIHDIAGIANPSDVVLDNQVGNTVRPTLVAETGRAFALSDSASLRPFVEARAGDETLLRAGFDVTLGRVGQGELLVRDSVSGHRYRTIQNQDNPGFTFVMGADIAHVEDSVYFPASSTAVMEDTRTRARAGLHWQGQKSSAFYGVTWLSEEFAGQGEGQLIGAIRLKLKF